MKRALFFFVLSWGASCGGGSTEAPSTFTCAFHADAAPQRGQNAYHVEVRDAQGPVEHAYVEAFASMPAMGHDAPARPTTTELQGGTYAVTNVSYNMPGTWELRLEITASGRAGRCSTTAEVP